MTDMRYMDHLDDVAADAVGLIREKTSTYGDSWKRRGGPGAWFTTVRPIDRLEGIVERWKGDIFDAIDADNSGRDGSALACIRDIMNYCILIEAHARATLGVRPHGPTRILRYRTLDEVRAEMHPEGTRFSCDECRDVEHNCRKFTDERFPGKVFCGRECAQKYAETPVPPAHRPGTPEDGGHHALETAGEVTQDAGEAGGSAVATVEKTLEDRLRAFESSVRQLAGHYDLRITCTGGDDGLCRHVRILD